MDSFQRVKHAFPPEEEINILSKKNTGPYNVSTVNPASTTDQYCPEVHEETHSKTTKDVEPNSPCMPGC